MNASPVDARNARAEAAARAGDTYEVRVLEPSPPAVDDGKWFADDPVTNGAAGDQPVVSPVPNGTWTWAELAADDPSLVGFAGPRWLVATNRLLVLPATFAASRDALHRVAVHVPARARHAANGKFGLRWTLHGFGTPFFGDDQQVRVVEDCLVVQRGTEAEHAPIESLAQCAELAGVDLAAPFSVGDDTPDLGDASETVAVDRAAGAALGEWYGFSASLLELVRHEIGAAGGEASRVQIWPEHFDIAFDGAHPGAVRANFGCSPGDSFHPEPYVYVGPWDKQEGSFWNAPFGAFLPYSEIVPAADQRATAMAFVKRALTRLAPYP